MLVLTWSPYIGLKAMHSVILPLPQPLLKGIVQQFWQFCLLPQSPVVPDVGNETFIISYRGECAGNNITIDEFGGSSSLPPPELKTTTTDNQNE